jgi:guanylate kinase
MIKRVLYLVGPTCCGKSSIGTSLQNNYGYGSIVSTTTRLRRPTDNIFFTQFTSRDEFNELIKDDELIEFATYSNEYYGTRKSSILSGFKDSDLAVKVIEVNGLLQILKSGFHEVSGIDFFIVYVNPMYDGYDDQIKSRVDWEVRLQEDRDLYTLFKKQIKALAPNNKYRVVTNKGTLAKVVSDINNLCIFSDKDYKFLRSMMRIPSYVSISKNDEEFDYHLTLVDTNYHTKTSNYFLSTGDIEFNAIDYVANTFKEHIHYVNEEYIAITLLDYGMLVVLWRKGSIKYVQEKIHEASFM